MVGIAFLSPYAVSMRNSKNLRGGTGRNGQYIHQRSGMNRRQTRSVGIHSRGRARSPRIR